MSIRIRGASARQSPAFRAGTAADTTDCVALWVRACAERDGVAVAGVAERAQPKFDHGESWIVAEETGAGIRGFVLATTPKSGLPTDPPDAAVVSLLAVVPGAQGSGLGRALLVSIANELKRQGHKRAVLHVLADNRPALDLYSSEDWRPLGEPFPHSLLNRPTQTYVLDLDSREEAALVTRER
ncbi:MULTISPECIES: GNAT family N-acetyltransferase [unclassified Cryobacterium]|uniref:GNAT family N-acetyltransferase n=1 Tax=unclassified Cryobacterium TaxID=2649013 RepID=UPI002AB57B46|nr:MULTISPECIES: GNAT family N-acetyltransferase [unclassified Cryobacterium]MDY7542417.1 GNAT family N-acetyltransferase [Cryobacterium sp. 5B3]MEB0000698.1 GNAT family N-acetyltransferase [Cryobacterium sp. RTS3]MEB0266995.1 GNAT family N-acetyltransferase [Cryobacterium sp. 10I5]MEB0275045.1 GNAT family N-acetyltransferase [Cryobacterium sp. 5B3]